MEKVVIVSAVRTAIGSFMGSLSGVPATDLGAAAISGAIERANIQPDQVDEVLMGNVLQAGLGQAPARQAAMKAGLPDSVPCTTINKVCSSGMKAITLAAQSIALGDTEIVVAGGMESMSGTPFYLPKARAGNKFGHTQAIDGLVHDGLQDAYDPLMMGNCAELCVSRYDYTREQQDDFAIESYTRAANAWKAGKFDQEIVPFAIPQRKGDPVIFDHDEEYTKVDFDKLRTLRPAFQKDGSVTAGNASTLNDGAAALVLMSEKKAKELGLTPLVEIRGYADAAHEPKYFTTAPSLALPKALDKAGVKQEEVDFFELNEAFAVVGLANTDLLGLDPKKVNVHGGAVSLGHPLGVSGARILVTLIHILQHNKAKLGAAGICNGGGGATAVVIENLGV